MTYTPKHKNADRLLSANQELGSSAGVNKAAVLLITVLVLSSWLIHSSAKLSSPQCSRATSLTLLPCL